MVMDQLRDIKHQFQNEIEGSEDLSLEAEKRIARSFMGRIEWEMIAIGLTQCFLWCNFCSRRNSRKNIKMMNWAI